MSPKDPHDAGQGLSREEALECRPVKNDQVVESRSDGGDLLLSYPVAVRPWAAGLIRRMGWNKGRTVYRKKLQLDALGTEVWELLDGRRTVRQVIGRFAAAHRLPEREAAIAVTRFIRELGRRGLIGLQGSKGNRPA
jgi:hypothetical protein